MSTFPLLFGNSASSGRRCLIQLKMPARGMRKFPPRIPRFATPGHQVSDPLEMFR
ncbi:MAG: hypothetical protein JWR69_355, partial [Pedosphaera sp.]|nr:hypothetical protein [Pedosphaera sp.]